MSETYKFTPPETLDGKPLKEARSCAVSVMGIEDSENRAYWVVLSKGSSIKLVWDKFAAKPGTIEVADSSGNCFGYLPDGEVKDMIFDWIKNGYPIFAEVGEMGYSCYGCLISVAFYA